MKNKKNILIIIGFCLFIIILVSIMITKNNKDNDIIKNTNNIKKLEDENKENVIDKNAEKLNNIIEEEGIKITHDLDDVFKETGAKSSFDLNGIIKK